MPESFHINNVPEERVEFLQMKYPRLFNVDGTIKRGGLQADIDPMDESDISKLLQVHQYTPNVRAHVPPRARKLDKPAGGSRE